VTATATVPVADGRARWRPRRTDLIALGLWGGSRLVMLVISLAALAAQPGTSWLNLWQRWDWDRYLTIAQYGYTSGKGPAYDTNIVAFFPGYPGLLRAVDLVVRNWVVAGLLISLVAGAVACVALARLTEYEWRARQQSGSPGWVVATAVLVLVTAPAAVFLAAGYTESLFLAMAIPAWLAARRRQWLLAGVLTALACTVRIDGAFEAAALAVMFLLSRPRARDWARSPALALPLVAVGAYFAYLKDITGDWLGWFHAEASGWSRRLTNPVTAFRTSWANAFGSGPLAGGRGFGGGRSGNFNPGSPSNRKNFGNPNTNTHANANANPNNPNANPNNPNANPNNPSSNFRHSSGVGHSGRGGSGPGGGPASGRGQGQSQGLGQGQGQQAFSGHGLGGVGPFGPWPFRLDILMVLAGVAFLGWAAFRRRWAELTYVGLAVVALATSTYYMSVAREALLWWPLWIALASWLSRRRWLTGLYLTASTAMMTGMTWLFLTGHWAG
jgi:hypothetical protein